jgi:hypothetical protein
MRHVAHGGIHDVASERPVYLRFFFSESNYDTNHELMWPRLGKCDNVTHK